VSPRKQQVYAMLLEAKTYHEIGKLLFISPETVKSHARQIYSEHNVNNRYELMALVIKSHSSPPLKNNQL